MKTKFYYITLPLVVLFALSSCNRTDPDSSNDQGGSSEQEESEIQDWEDTAEDVDAQKVVWSGEVGDSFYDGAVYADNESYYYITTGEELAYLASLVNDGKDMTDKNFYLLNSIDLNNHLWTPIGGEAEFNGTFYGYDFTIQNLYFNHEELDWTSGVGIFGTVGQSGTISELNVKDANITCDGQAGGIAGINLGAIESCTFNGDISSTWNCAGGIVGMNSGGVIYDCSSSGSIYVDPSSNAYTGSDDFGGVAGFSSGGLIYYCYNEMDIDTAGSNVGGVVGNCIEDAIVYSCYNTGDISGNSNVGGVVGYCSNSEITALYNRGVVTGVVSYQDNEPNTIGGVIGTINDLNPANGDSYCTSLYNTGNVVCEEGNSNLAGVIGLCYMNASHGYTTEDESMGYYYNNAWHTINENLNSGAVVSNIGTLTEELMLSETGLLSYLNTGAAGYWKADTEGVNDGYPILSGMEY